jgi:pectate lyase
MQKTAKKFVSFVVVAMFGLMALAPLASADAKNVFNPWGTNNLKTGVSEGLGLGTQDVRITIANIINIALGLLGIVAVVIVLMGGFKWMTASGEEGKVDEAKKLITQGIVGLAIIVSAYAIAQFVVDSLMDATKQ